MVVVIQVTGKSTVCPLVGVDRSSFTKLALSPDGFENVDDAGVADSLEHMPHAVSALAELVLGLGGG